MLGVLRFLWCQDWAVAWFHKDRATPVGDQFMLFGVGFCNLTLDETVRRAEEILASPKASHIAVTPNSVSLLQSRKDPRLREAYRQANLVLPDGVGIVWASRLLGVPLKERVTGIDLAEALLKQASVNGQRVFLLGGKDGVAERAARRLEERFPGLTITGTHHGYFSKEIEPLAAIRKARPQILLVGMGVPKQEAWMLASAAALQVPLMIGVGGALDVFAGDRRRASRCWQRLGLEWLYRLAHQPRRIRKVPAIPCFIGHVLWTRVVTALSPLIHLATREA